jgi:hypothetical protein
MVIDHVFYRGADESSPNFQIKQQAKHTHYPLVEFDPHPLLPAWKSNCPPATQGKERSREMQMRWAFWLCYDDGGDRVSGA